MEKLGPGSLRCLLRLDRCAYLLEFLINIVVVQERHKVLSLSITLPGQ